MAVERRNPVPPGRYYVYLKADEEGAWSAWTHQFADRVRVIATESQSVSPDSPVWATTPTGGIVKEHVGDWVLFDVTAPVPWVNLGLPTIVTDPGVKSSVDVYKYPAPSPDQGPLDVLASLAQSLGSLAFIGGALVLGNFLLQSVRGTRKAKRS